MPDWREEIIGRLRALKLAPAREAEIVEEMSQHLEDRYKELVTSGAAEEEARRVALGELSDEERLASGLRRVEQVVSHESIAPGGGGRSNFLESILQDIRYGLRQLRHSPGFTAVAVLTLALGIGANTAIFSVVYAVLLRPLPYANPDRLVSVFEQKLDEGVSMAGSTYPDFDQWRQHNQVFSAVAGQAAHDLTLTGRGEPSVVETVVATPELFTVLGVKPIAGRTFLPADGEKGAATGGDPQREFMAQPPERGPGHHRKFRHAGPLSVHRGGNHAGQLSLSAAHAQPGRLDPARR